MLLRQHCTYVGIGALRSYERRRQCGGSNDEYVGSGANFNRNVTSELAFQHI